MIDKILERFRKARVDMNIPVDADSWSYIRAISKCEAIVQEVAKDGGWIPCSERLPERPKIGEDSYLVQCEYIVEPYTAYWDGEKWFGQQGDQISQS